MVVQIMIIEIVEKMHSELLALANSNMLQLKL